MSDKWHLGLPGVKSPDAEDNIHCHECGQVVRESEISSWSDSEPVCNDCYGHGLDFRDYVKGKSRKFRNNGSAKNIITLLTVWTAGK